MAGFEISDCSYLFYYGARHEQMNEILKLCKNVTKMTNMFNYNTKLVEIDLSNLDTTNLTEMNSLFNRCSQLIKCICKINTTNVTVMNQIFYNCSKLKELDISTFDTTNVNQMSSMFYGCSQLPTLDLSHFNTPNLTNMGEMFYGCSKLTDLDLTNFNTSNVTSIGQIFYNCTNLKNLNLGGLDGSEITTAGNAYRSCTALENLIFMNNYGKGFTSKSANNSNYGVDLSYSKNLTHDSIVDLKSKLYDLNLTYNVAGGGTLYTQKLVIGPNNIAKVDPSIIAEITAKGWTVS